MHANKHTRFVAATIVIAAIIISGAPSPAAAMNISDNQMFAGKRQIFSSPIMSNSFGRFALVPQLSFSKYFSLDMTPNEETITKERIALIDTYFEERSMPLAGYGMFMVEIAEENNLDWRLLPAIAVRESSGGKKACGFNPFGWASCKRRFESFEDAIRTVGHHLGGNHPKTDRYYSGDTLTKLMSYNGTVIPDYPDEVIAIMDKIGSNN